MIVFIFIIFIPFRLSRRRRQNFFVAPLAQQLVWLRPFQRAIRVDVYHFSRGWGWATRCSCAWACLSSTSTGRCLTLILNVFNFNILLLSVSVSVSQPQAPLQQPSSSFLLFDQLHQVPHLPPTTFLHPTRISTASSPVTHYFQRIASLSESMEILELVVALSAVARRAPAGAAGAALLKGAEGIFHLSRSTTFYDRQIIITTFGCIISMSMTIN